MAGEPDPDERRQVLAQLLESTSDVVWMFSADWEETIFVNDAYEAVWGRPTEALEGTRPTSSRGSTWTTARRSGRR